MTAPDYRTELLLTGKRSTTSARYENILVQSRRLPTSSSFGKVTTLHSTLIGFRKPATTSFFSRAYSTFYSTTEKKGLSTRLSVGRRRNLVEEEGLSVSQIGAVHRELKGRLAGLTKAKITVPEEQIVPGTVTLNYLRSKSARSGDYLLRVSSTPVIPTVKISATQSAKIKLGIAEAQKTRINRKNVFRSQKFSIINSTKLNRRTAFVAFCDRFGTPKNFIRRPTLFPILMQDEMKNRNFFGYNIFNFKGHKRSILDDFYHSTRKKSSEQLREIKSTAETKHTILKRRPAFSTEIKHISILTGASTLTKLKRSVIRSAQ